MPDFENEYARLKREGASAEAVYRRMVADKCFPGRTLSILCSLFSMTLEDAIALARKLDAEIFSPFARMRDAGRPWREVYDGIREEYDAMTALRITIQLYEDVSITDVKRYVYGLDDSGSTGGR